MAGLTPKRWRTAKGEMRAGYQVSWYDGAGKRRFKRFSGPGAQAKAKKFRNKTENERPTLGPGTTVEQAGKLWTDHVELEKRRERTTYEGYRRHLARHICPAVIPLEGEDRAFGTIAVAELDGPACDALKRVLLDTKGTKLASRLMRSLRMMLNDTQRRGLIHSNPAAGIKVEQIDRGEDQVIIPQKPEVARLLEAVTVPPPGRLGYAEVWIWSSMITGMRPSESRGAAIEDLTLDGPKPGIHVRRRADEWCRLGAVKTKAGRRFIPIGPALVKLFRRWLLVVPRGRQVKDKATGQYVTQQPTGVPDPENPGRRIHLLFPTSDGTVQTLSNIFNRVWGAAMTAAELVDQAPGGPVARYPMNCLRHLAASLMIADGLNPKQLQSRMGHSSVKVTYDLYGHLFDEAEADNAAATRIEALFLGEQRANKNGSPRHHRATTTREGTGKTAENRGKGGDKPGRGKPVL